MYFEAQRERKKLILLLNSWDFTGTWSFIFQSSPCGIKKTPDSFNFSKGGNTSIIYKLILEKLRGNWYVRDLGSTHSRQFQYPTTSNQSLHTNNCHEFHGNACLDVVSNETNKVSPSSHLLARETWFLRHVGTAHTLGRKHKTLGHIQIVCQRPVMFWCVMSTFVCTCLDLQASDA